MSEASGGYRKGATVSAVLNKHCPHSCLQQTLAL